MVNLPETGFKETDWEEVEHRLTEVQVTRRTKEDKMKIEVTTISGMFTGIKRQVGKAQTRQNDPSNDNGIRT